MSSRIRALPLKTYVVYVTYPSSAKEYAYLCNIPGLVQGDEVIINNTKVKIVRTADSDARALKWVAPLPNHAELRNADRIQQIKSRLGKIAELERQLTLWSKLKSPEAKKLVAELKGLL